MKIKIILLTALFLIAGCKGKTKVSQEQPADINFEDTSLNKKSNKIYSRYQIPLPVDLFSVLKEEGEFNKAILLPENYHERLNNDIHKAIILGIYNADLAYCSVLGQGQSTLDYFNASKKTAQELNIDEGYSDEFYDKMNKYMNNVDSLIQYVNTAYRNTCNYMEERQMNNILPFVVVAGWYESLYIILNSTNPNLTSQKIEKTIVNQQKGFERVKQFIYDEQISSSAFYYHKNLKNLIEDIDKILKLYKLYKINPADRDKTYQMLKQEIIKQRKDLVRGEV